MAEHDSTDTPANPESTDGADTERFGTQETRWALNWTIDKPSKAARLQRILVKYLDEQGRGGPWRAASGVLTFLDALDDEQRPELEIREHFGSNFLGLDEHFVELVEAAALLEAALEALIVRHGDDDDPGFRGVRLGIRDVYGRAQEAHREFTRAREAVRVPHAPYEHETRPAVW